jgi:hypothetical protein
MLGHKSLPWQLDSTIGFLIAGVSTIFCASSHCLIDAVSFDSIFFPKKILLQLEHRFSAEVKNETCVAVEPNFLFCVDKCLREPHSKWRFFAGRK